MTDTVSPEVRSRIMSKVKSRDTAPELKTRSKLHAAGFRFSLHRSDLPGRPDIVLPRFKTAVFVNGCFWHGHDCRDGRLPSSNREYWAEKIARNAKRDQQNHKALAELGWTVVVIWECNLDAAVDSLIGQLRELSNARWNTSAKR